MITARSKSLSEIDEEVVTELLGAARELRVTNITKLGVGRDWAAFKAMVETTSPYSHMTDAGRGPCAWTIRVRPRMVKAQPYSLHCALSPFTGFRYLQSGLDYSWDAHVYVDGVLLDSVLSDDRSTAHIEGLATYLRSLHRAAPPHGSQPFAGEVWSLEVGARLAYAHGTTTREGLLGPDILDKLSPISVGSSSIGHCLRSLGVQPTSLLHGDLGPRNIIVDESTGRFNGLIDWDQAHCGDYLHDLANWTTFTHVKAGWIDQMMQTYHGEAHLPESVWDRFWLYYLVISVEKLVKLWRYGVEDLTVARARVDRALEIVESYS